MCHHCGGKGLIRSSQSNAILILRTIEKELSNQKLHALNVYAHSESILYILNKKREDIRRIEQDFKVEINFYDDKMATLESFSLEKIKLQQRQPKQEIQETKFVKEYKKPAKHVTLPIEANSIDQNDLKFSDSEIIKETRDNLVQEEPKEGERKKRTNFQRRRKPTNKANNTTFTSTA
jgi:hypothetical protein